MTAIFSTISEFINYMIAFLGTAGPILGCFLIVIESMIPILPLCVFITLNCISFGYVIGFIISWLCTCLGCFLSFIIFRKGIKNWFDKKVRVIESANKIMKIIEKCSISQLAVIVAVPFTPAFLVNIAAGVSKIETKKFLIGMIIGKFFMVYFWGFIGTNLIQSLTHPIILLKVAFMLFVAYTLSKIVTKKFGL